MESRAVSEFPKYYTTYRGKTKAELKSQGSTTENTEKLTRQSRRRGKNQDLNDEVLNRHYTLETCEKSV